MNNSPRVPLSESINLIGLKRTLQVNHCKNPSCGNFGIPARVEHGKPGPSSDRDTRYKLHSTSKGQTPSIRCKGVRRESTHQVQHRHRERGEPLVECRWAAQAG